MRPTLEIGDTVIVSEGAIARGDVIVFHTRDGLPICHRAVVILPWWGTSRIIHKGDAVGSGHGVLGAEHLIGRAVAVRTGGSGPTRPLPRRRPTLRASARALLAVLLSRRERRQ